MKGITDNSSEAVKGGFRAIERFEGLLLDVNREPGKFEDDSGVIKDQAKVEYEDVTILKIFPGEDEPTLEDNKFVFWITYAKPEKEKPHVNSFFAKAFQKSAEILCKERGDATPGLTALIGTRCVM